MTILNWFCLDFISDIPKPNRKFNSPFFRLDQDVIEGRQILLENYLKVGCCVLNSSISSRPFFVDVQ